MTTMTYPVSETRLEGVRAPEMINDFIRLMSKLSSAPFSNNGVCMLLSHEFVALSLRGCKSLKAELETLAMSVGSYWQPEQIGLKSPAQIKLKNKQCATILSVPVIGADGTILGYVAYVSQDPEDVYLAEMLLMMLAEYLIEAGVNRQHTLGGKINQLYVDAVASLFLVIDDDGFVVHASHAFCQQFDVKASDIQNASLQEFFLFPPKIRTVLEQGGEFDFESVDFDFAGKLKQLHVALKPLDGRLKALCFAAPIVHSAHASQRLLPTLDRFATESSLMKRVINSAREAVKGTSPIYILGEEGTGKRSLALSIHNSCERYGKGPFIAVNLHSAKKSDLSALLLGGEESGGAKSKFEMANGGTLYIERIDLLPGVLQAALTHIILTKTLFDIHSNTSINLNFRLITSSIKPLEELVHERRFCPSLYFYLTGATLNLPNLQSRPEDVELLVDRKLADLSGGEEHVDQTLCSALKEYAVKRQWPGNISELFKWVEHTYLNRENMILDADHVDAGALGTPIQPLEEMEKREIANALTTLDRKYHIVAEQLGISLSTLRRKIAKYDL